MSVSLWAPPNCSPRPYLRVCLGKLRGEHEGPGSTTGLLFCHTRSAAQNNSLLVPSGATLWLGRGLQRSRPPTGASAQLQAQAPLLLRCWQWARTSVHGCRDTKPLLPSPAACPCWARSKMYENTLIISFKLLRNKVILFFFYNPSKKKSSH